MKKTKQRVVIIGGGFGGAFSAKFLRRYGAHDFEINLINSTNYFVFQPLLPEVVSGTISSPDAVTPRRYMLPGFSTRLRVALNWMFDYVLPRSIVQIANNQGTATAYRHYARGDVICRPGQTIDGLYTVITGAMESRIPDREGRDDFIRVLGPGDHWGELGLASEALVKGTLTATEESQILVLQRSDFLNLCAAFPAMRDYFEKIDEKSYAPSLRGGSENSAD